jgi:hypothetical protein
VNVHGRRHRGHRGGPRLGTRWYERETVVDRLEEYRRDLEQELADVSDLLERLKPHQAETQS